MVLATLSELRRSPGYIRFYAAALLARTSNEMFVVAVVLLVLDRTGSASLAGAVVAAFALPSIMSGAFLGAWLDASRRKTAIIAADQAITFAAVLGLALTVGTADWLLVVLAFAAGVTSPLASGGFTSLIPSIVPTELRHSANALEAASFNASIVAGPAIAGIVAIAAGPRAAVLAQCALNLVAFALVATLRVAGTVVAPAARSMLRTVVTGLRHVVKTPPLLAVTVTGAIALGGRGLLTVAFPVFAASELGTSRNFGAFLWTAFAVGSIVGIFVVTGRAARWSPVHTALRAVAVAGLIMFLWPLARSPAVALVLIALAGAAYGPGLAATFAVRQRWTPPELHGQIFTTSASLKPGSFALGAAAAGPLVVGLGADATLVVAAAVQIVAFGTGSLLLHRGAGHASADREGAKAA